MRGKRTCFFASIWPPQITSTALPADDRGRGGGGNDANRVPVTCVERRPAIVLLALAPRAARSTSRMHRCFRVTVKTPSAATEAARWGGAIRWRHSTASRSSLMTRAVPPRAHEAPSRLPSPSRWPRPANVRTVVTPRLLTPLCHRLPAGNPGPVPYNGNRARHRPRHGNGPIVPGDGQNAPERCFLLPTLNPRATAKPGRAR